MQYLVGSAKVDLTFFRDKCGMLGYGRHFHYMRGIETRQFARAFAFRDQHRHFVIVCVEFCFCTDYLKHGVLLELQTQYPELGYHDANVMILAQHTHSAAGGYGQHLAYNLTTPGFQQDVYDCYCTGIVQAIVQAHQAQRPAVIRQHEGAFDDEAEVAFNRSVRAYNANPDIEEKIPFKKRHLAANRTMKLLRIDTPDGTPLSSINWFGTHTTSVSNRRDKVCADNKGYAAEMMETLIQDEDSTDIQFISAFAQAPTGDISPNYIWNRKHLEYRGKFEDDYESASYNGRLQCDKATAIFHEAPHDGTLIQGGLDYGLMYVDMTRVDVSPDLANGIENAATSWATFGVAFLEGTTDGQGLSKVAGALLKGMFHVAHRFETLAARLAPKKERSIEILRQQRAQRPKKMFMNLSKGIVVGTSYPEKMILPDALDPVIKYLKYMNRLEKRVKAPWSPERMPVQLFILGQLAIIGVPSEITTIAGKRLRATVLDVLRQRGVQDAVVCSYANSYAGYITTPEEYHIQAYEGGHTLFGKWTLPAYQMQFRALATELLKSPEERNPLGCEPFYFDKEDIWKGFADEGIRVL